MKHGSTISTAETEGSSTHSADGGSTARRLDRYQPVFAPPGAPGRSGRPATLTLSCRPPRPGDERESTALGSVVRRPRCPPESMPPDHTAADPPDPQLAVRFGAGLFPGPATFRVRRTFRQRADASARVFLPIAARRSCACRELAAATRVKLDDHRQGSVVVVAWSWLPGSLRSVHTSRMDLGTFSSAKHSTRGCPPMRVGDAALQSASRSERSLFSAAARAAGRQHLLVAGPPPSCA